MNLQEIRQQYPQYDNLTDEQLATGLYKTYYADKLEFGDFAQRVEYQPEKTKPGLSLGRLIGRARSEVKGGISDSLKGRAAYLRKTPARNIPIMGVNPLTMGTGEYELMSEEYWGGGKKEALADKYEEVSNTPSLQRDKGYEETSGFIEDVVGGVSGFLPSMALQVVSPGKGTEQMYFQLLGSQYQAMIDNKVDPDRAFIAASLSSLVQVPLESAGNVITIGAIKRLAKGKLQQFMLGLAQSMVGEGLEEYLQAYPEEIANMYAMNPDLESKELIDEIKTKLASVEFQKSAGYQSLVGAGGGALMVGGAQAVKTTGDLATYITSKQKKINQEKQKFDAQQFSRDLAAGAISLDDANTIRDQVTAIDPELGATYSGAIEAFEKLGTKGDRDKAIVDEKADELFKEDEVIDLTDVVSALPTTIPPEVPPGLAGLLPEPPSGPAIPLPPETPIYVPDQVQPYEPPTATTEDIIDYEEALGLPEPAKGLPEPTQIQLPPGELPSKPIEVAETGEVEEKEARVTLGEKPKPLELEKGKIIEGLEGHHEVEHDDIFGGAYQFTPKYGPYKGNTFSTGTTPPTLKDVQAAFDKMAETWKGQERPKSEWKRDTDVERGIPPEKPQAPEAGKEAVSPNRIAERYVEIAESANKHMPFAVAMKNARRLIDAINNGVWTDLLDPSNKVSRTIFEEITGKKLPKTLKGSRELIESFPDLAPKEPETIPFDDLSDRAKGAIASDARVRNEPPEAFTSSQWVPEKVSLESLKKENESVWGDEFTKRGSVNKGPLIVDDKGIVLDGNNRLREAIERGDKEIDILRRMPTPKEPGEGEKREINRIADKLIEWKKSERLTDPEGFRSSWSEYDDGKQKAIISELVERGELPISFSKRKIDGIKTVPASEILSGLTRGFATDKFTKPTPEKKAPAEEARKRIKAKLKDQRGSISFQKMKADDPALYDDLLAVSQDILAQGHTQFSEFRAEMRRVFSDVWEKIRRFIYRLWQDAKRILKSEEGAITFKKGDPKKAIPTEDRADLISKYLPPGKRPVGKGLERQDKTPSEISDYFGRKEGTINEKIGEGFRKAKKSWRTQFFDRLHPIKQLGPTTYMLHRLETGTQSVIAMLLRHGKLQWNGKAMTVETSNQGFLTWLKSTGDDANKLFYWVAAKRAERLELEGRERWLTANARKVIFDWVGEKPKSAKSWDELNNKFQEFNKSVLDIAQHAGLINPENRQQWEQDYYVPFYRLFEDEITRAEFLKGPYPNVRHIDAQIRRLLGGKRKIGDPIENIIKNWSHLIHESMRNVARAEAFDAAQEIGLKSELTDENGNLIPVIETLTRQDLVSVLGSREKKQWATVKKGSEKASALFDTKEEAVTWAKHLKDRYKKEYNVDLRKTQTILFGNAEDYNILSFRRDGKPIHYRVNDPELFHALAVTNKADFNNVFMKMFGGAKRLLTYGATFGPAFRVANMLRDTLHTAIISKSFIPFLDSFKGFAKAMKEDQDFIKFAASGAAFGSSYVRADDPKALAKYIQRIVKKEGKGASDRILDTPKKLLDFWEKIGSASENAARVALYARRIKEEVPHLEAAFEARDLLDFTMKGESGAVQFLIQMIPFMNARMQGLYKLGRAAGENPKSFALKGGMITLASLVLWAFNRDKDEWKELEDWDKRTYYHFWVGKAHFRIPKPFEVGAIFSSLFESAADTLIGEDDIGDFVNFLKHTAVDTFAINPTPQLVRPIVEQWANKSFFTGRPIEREGLKRLVPGERKEVWTSETLQLAGKLGIPPKRAEEFIRGYFATFGMFMLGISDIVFYHLADFPTEPTKKIDDYPLLGRFIKSSVAPRHTKYMTKFYDIFNEVDQVVATVNNYKRLGEMDKARDLATTNRSKLRLRSFLFKTRSRISKINQNIKRVSTNRRLSPDEKREQINTLVNNKNALVKRVYQVYSQSKQKIRAPKKPQRQRGGGLLRYGVGGS